MTPGAKWSGRDYSRPRARADLVCPRRLTGRRLSGSLAVGPASAGRPGPYAVERGHEDRLKVSGVAVDGGEAFDHVPYDEAPNHGEASRRWSSACSWMRQ
jgi:hypothetical protein